jgi:hypothetical protein
MDVITVRHQGYPRRRRSQSRSRSHDAVARYSDRPDSAILPPLVARQSRAAERVVRWLTRAPCQTGARTSRAGFRASACLTGRLWRGLIPRPVWVPSMERGVAAVAPRATPRARRATVVAGSITASGHSAREWCVATMAPRPAPPARTASFGHTHDGARRVPCSGAG